MTIKPPSGEFASSSPAEEEKIEDKLGQLFAELSKAKEGSDIPEQAIILEEMTQIYQGIIWNNSLEKANTDQELENLRSTVASQKQELAQTKLALAGVIAEKLALESRLKGMTTSPLLPRTPTPRSETPLKSAPPPGRVNLDDMVLPPSVPGSKKDK